MTLPKNVREQLGLKAGDKLDCSVAGDGSIVLRRKKLDVSDLVGILHVPGKHATIEEMNEAVGQAVVERVGRSKEQA